jgi:hypothetical protein
VTDFPCAAFPVELMDAYPNAKIILTTREPTSWFSSMDDTILRAARLPLAEVLARLDNVIFGPFADMVRRLFQFFFDAQDLANADPHVFMKRHEEHYDFVRAAAAERGMPCLDLDVELDSAAKWEKVCAFLGKEIPAEPWPNINDRGQFDKKVRLATRLVISAVMSRSFRFKRTKLPRRM